MLFITSVVFPMNMIIDSLGDHFHSIYYILHPLWDSPLIDIGLDNTLNIIVVERRLNSVTYFKKSTKEKFGTKNLTILQVCLWP